MDTPVRRFIETGTAPSFVGLRQGLPTRARPVGVRGEAPGERS